MVCWDTVLVFDCKQNFLAQRTHNRVVFGGCKEEVDESAHRLNVHDHVVVLVNPVVQGCVGRAIQVQPQPAALGQFVSSESVSHRVAWIFFVLETRNYVAGQFCVCMLFHNSLVVEELVVPGWDPEAWVWSLQTGVE